jgi:WD40 repeat protein
LATGSWDYSIKIWEISTGKLIKSIDTNSEINCLQILPNGYLISGDLGGNISAWSLVNDSQVLIDGFQYGHTNSVYDFALFNGKILASAGGDNITILWNIFNQKKIASLIGHSDQVSVLLPVSSTILASGSADSTTKLWNLQNYSLIETLFNSVGPIGISLDILSSDVLISGNTNRFDIWKISKGNLLGSFNTSYDFNALIVLESDNIVSRSIGTRLV